MASKREQILGAILVALQAAAPNAQVERNAERPLDLEDVPRAGLVILRDGSLSEPESEIGTGAVHYYELTPDIEAYSPAGDEADLDALAIKIQTGLTADSSFGGLVSYILVNGFDFGEFSDEGVAAIPGALVSITFVFETTDLLG